MPIAVRFLLILLVLAAGPVVLILATSDQSRAVGYGQMATAILQSPFGAYLAVLVAYSVMILGALDRQSLQRIALSLAALVLILATLLVVCSPLLFAYGEGSRATAFYGTTVIAGFCLLPAAIVHHFILRTGISAFVEVPAHLLTLLVPALLFGFPWFSGAGYSYMSDVGRIHFLGAWPVLSAIIPFAAILVWRQSRIGFAKAVVLCAVVVAMTYGAKAAVDAWSGKEMALQWPIRVASEFLPPLKQPQRIGPFIDWKVGTPVAIGAHSYRFDHTVHQFDWDDGSTTFSVNVPSDDLGVSSSTGSPGRTGLIFRVWQPGPLFTGTGYVWTRYEDLVINIWAVPSISNSEIREIMAAYLAAARVPD